MIKIKNGYKIEVKEWSDKVTVKDIKTGKIVKEISFSDHIKAVLMVKAL
jgi:hypothetical protein